MDRSGVYRRRDSSDLDTLKQSVARIEDRIDAVVKAQNELETVAKYKIAREAAISYNQSATARDQPASLKPVPMLKERNFPPSLGGGTYTAIEYPSNFPRTVFEFNELSKQPQIIADLLEFYDTKVFYRAGWIYEEVNSVDLAPADCLRELRREIGLKLA